MTYFQKISELKNIIQEKLTPLITNDYVFLGLPYHTNIGDSLIWEGSETFLRTLPYKCLYTASVSTFNPNYKIHPSTIIIINGGGSFGDLWRRNTKLWLYLVHHYPNNEIIILPQSIFYRDEKLLEEDAKIFSKHKKLTICLRDKNSLKIANHYFPNSINLLLPDMAFYIDMRKWEKHIKCVSNKILFLNRNDIEKKQNISYDIVPINAEIHDWPTMEKTMFMLRLFYKVQNFLSRADIICVSNLSNSFSDMLHKKIIRQYFIKNGMGFLSSYSDIYVTRLHAAILSILLQKQFVWFDNSYGKSSSFYDTWLTDFDSIKFIRE